MEISANNVANASTTGFKKTTPLFSDYMSAVPNGKPVDYVVMRGAIRDTTQGPVQRTGNQLDIALMGDGYIPVQTSSGTMYTRSGSFTTNQEGELITANDDKVLTADGQGITIPPDAKDITINTDGSIRTDQGEVGRLQAVTFKNEQNLVAVGNGLYRTSEAGEASTTTKIMQGAIEQSNVQPVLELTKIMEISRAYQQTTNLIAQEQDRIRNSVRTLGRLSS